MQVAFHYNDLFEALQKKLISPNPKKFLKLKTYEEDLELLIEAYKGLYEEDLIRNWDEHFPDVEYSYTLMHEEVNRFLDEQKKSQLNKFKEALEKEERIKQAFGFLINYQIFNIGILTLISIVCYVIGFRLIFTPSDLALGLGIVLVVSCIIIDIMLLKRYTTTLKRS